MSEAVIASPQVAMRPRHPAARVTRPITRFIRRQPVGAVCGLIIVLLTLVALFAPVLEPYDPTIPLRGARLEEPSWDYPFGTNEKSLDMLSRTIEGARVSLQVGFIA